MEGRCARGHRTSHEDGFIVARGRISPCSPSSSCTTTCTSGISGLSALLLPSSASATLSPLLPICRRVSRLLLFAYWVLSLGASRRAAAQVPQYVLANATVRTLAGQQGVTAPFSDGVGSAAIIAYPWGISLDSTGTLAVIVSVDGQRRRRWTRSLLPSPIASPCPSLLPCRRPTSITTSSVLLLSRQAQSARSRGDRASAAPSLKAWVVLRHLTYPLALLSTLLGH
jgi:hypothetical protein